jgi:hypothetical protein
MGRNDFVKKIVQQKRRESSKKHRAHVGNIVASVRCAKSHIA